MMKGILSFAVAQTKRFLFLGVLVSANAVMSVDALASPVTWNLTNITFGDGTVVTGSFVYDADTNTFSGLSMTTSGGSTVPATSSWVFNLANLPGSEQNAIGIAGFQAVDLASADESAAFDVSLFSIGGPLLTNAGGTIPLNFLRLGGCANATCANLDPGFLTDGSGQFTALSAVPEPLTLSLSSALALPERLRCVVASRHRDAFAETKKGQLDVEQQENDEKCSNDCNSRVRNGPGKWFSFCRYSASSGSGTDVDVAAGRWHRSHRRCQTDAP